MSEHRLYFSTTNFDHFSEFRQVREDLWARFLGKVAEGQIPSAFHAIGVWQSIRLQGYERALADERARFEHLNDIQKTKQNLIYAAFDQGRSLGRLAALGSAGELFLSLASPLTATAALLARGGSLTEGVVGYVEGKVSDEAQSKLAASATRYVDKLIDEVIRQATTRRGGSEAERIRDSLADLAESEGLTTEQQLALLYGALGRKHGRRPNSADEDSEQEPTVDTEGAQPASSAKEALQSIGAELKAEAEKSAQADWGALPSPAGFTDWTLSAHQDFTTAVRAAGAGVQGAMALLALADPGSADEFRRVSRVTEAASSIAVGVSGLAALSGAIGQGAALGSIIPVGGTAIGALAGGIVALMGAFGDSDTGERDAVIGMLSDLRRDMAMQFDRLGGMIQEVDRRAATRHAEILEAIDVLRAEGQEHYLELREQINQLSQVVTGERRREVARMLRQSSAAYATEAIEPWALQDYLTRCESFLVSELIDNAHWDPALVGTGTARRVEELLQAGAEFESASLQSILTQTYVEKCPPLTVEPRMWSVAVLRYLELRREFPDFRFKYKLDFIRDRIQVIAQEILSALSFDGRKGSVSVESDLADAASKLADAVADRMALRGGVSLRRSNSYYLNGESQMRERLLDGLPRLRATWDGVRVTRDWLTGLSTPEIEVFAQGMVVPVSPRLAASTVATDADIFIRGAFLILKSAAGHEAGGLGPNVTLTYKRSDGWIKLFIGGDTPIAVAPAEWSPDGRSFEWYDFIPASGRYTARFPRLTGTQKSTILIMDALLTYEDVHALSVEEPTAEDRMLYAFFQLKFPDALSEPSVSALFSGASAPRNVVMRALRFAREFHAELYRSALDAHSDQERHEAGNKPGSKPVFMGGKFDLLDYQLEMELADVNGTATITDFLGTRLVERCIQHWRDTERLYVGRVLRLVDEVRTDPWFGAGRPDVLAAQLMAREHSAPAPGAGV